MKRLLGFIIGAILGVLLAYAIRKVISQQNQKATTQPATIEKPVSPPAPAVPAETSASTFERPTAKFTVRRTGPRPQAPADGETVINNPSDTRTLTTPPAEVEPAETITAKSTTEPSQAAATNGKIETTKTADTNQADDFTSIYDLGEVSNRKLHEAGITTYAALAAASIEKLAEITGFPTARIERSEWLKQADRLAKGLPLEPTEQAVEPADER